MNIQTDSKWYVFYEGRVDVHKEHRTVRPSVVSHAFQRKKLKQTDGSQ